METENQKPVYNQVCRITIGFPVDSDSQAIEYKKKIGDILADIPHVRIDFNLTNMPVRPDGLG